MRFVAPRQDRGAGTAWRPPPICSPGARSRSAPFDPVGCAHSDGCSGRGRGEDDREPLQPKRRCLLRRLQSRRQGLSPDHDGRALLQALHTVRPAPRSRRRRRAREALRHVPRISPAWLDLGLVGELRAAVPSDAAGQVSSHVEAEHWAAWAVAVLPPSSAQLAAPPTFALPFPTAIRARFSSVVESHQRANRLLRRFLERSAGAAR